MPIFIKWIAKKSKKEKNASIKRVQPPPSSFQGENIRRGISVFSSF